MLFLPTSLSPYAVSIDATLNNTFNWVNQGDIQTDYKLQIFRNDTSASAYDSGKITSNLSRHVLPLNSLTNAIDYKYLLTVYSGVNSVISEYVFIKCNLKPVITMTVPSTISTQNYTFSANYSQVNNIPYNSFRFILYDSSNNIVVDSGKQYSYNITYTFTGFIASKIYKVECITESSYGIIATTNKQSFTVTYIYPDSTGTITGTALDNLGGIKLDWSAIIQVIGAVNGTSSYVTGKFNQGLNLNPSSSVVFTQEIPNEFTLNYWCKLPVGFTGDIVSFGSNVLKFGYNGKRFYLNYNGSLIVGNTVSLPTNFFLIGIKYNKAIIKSDTYTEYVM